MADALNIRIRMYRKGLGDRFLLTFTTDARRYHMLIDCGILKGTEDASQIMQDIVRDIKKETDGTLDLLVVTHEHWDHLSGFHQAREIWDDIKVNEVWMAWTEDPQNDDAKDLHNNLHEARARLKQHSLLPEQQLAIEEAIASLLLFAGEQPDDDLPTTRAAMLYAGGKSNGNVKFHRAGTHTSLNDIDGVRVYVLGPPASRELFKDQPSSSRSEIYTETQSLSLADTFFAAVVQRVDSSDDPIEPRALPFGKHYRIEERTAKQRRFFRERYFGDGADDLAAWRRIDDDWLGGGGALALSLASDTNNTSLVLAIELTASGQVLLFPGDAQVGNWLSWRSYTWLVPGADGQAREVKADELLGRTVFYKVAHHGSENATLSNDGLERMRDDRLVAMIPVDEEMAKQQGQIGEDGKRKGWAMPFGPLLTALKSRTAGRVIRADKGLPTRAEAAALSDAEWEHFQQVAVADPNGLYIDYTITG
jgi:hypothetical protein